MTNGSYVRDIKMGRGEREREHFWGMGGGGGSEETNMRRKRRENLSLSLPFMRGTMTMEAEEGGEIGRYRMGWRQNRLI